MLDVTVNGVEKSYSEGTKVADILRSEGYDAGRVAVEINLNIIPKGTFSEKEIQNGDRIEIVSFVGGG